MTRTRYIIKFYGILEYGFVKIALFSKSYEKNLAGSIEGHKWATKFRWLWMARLVARFLNTTDDKLRTYRAEEAIEHIPHHTNI